MLDRNFVVENADLVQQNCRGAAPRPTSISLSRSKPSARDKQAELEKLNRQANEVSQIDRQGQGRRRARSPQEQGRELREQTTAAQAEIDAIVAGVGRHSTARFPTCRIRTRRPAPTTRPIWKFATGKHAPAEVRFQAARSRRAWAKSSICSTSRGAQSRRPRLLFPEERRRAAGAGPAALRARFAHAPRASRPRSRPTWHATKSCKAPATSRAGRKRRSTASPIAI